MFEVVCCGLVWCSVVRRGVVRRGVAWHDAILDFSKAFKTVSHDKLLHKLDAYGIKGNSHKWLT